MSESARTINRRLKTLYGNCPIVGVQKYRVVRSEHQTEKRGGDYNVFCGPIFLRRERGVREVKKYWNIPNCWVLERVEPNMERYTLIPEKYTYEPFLTFLTKDNKPLPLTWKAIELACGKMKVMEKRFRNEMDDHAEEEKRLAEERDIIKGKIDDELDKQVTPTFAATSVMNDTKLLLDNAKIVRGLSKASEDRIVNSIMKKKTNPFDVQEMLR